MPRPVRYPERITAWVSEETKTTLHEAAKQRNLDPAVLVRRLIEKGVSPPVIRLRCSPENTEFVRKTLAYINYDPKARKSIDLHFHAPEDPDDPRAGGSTNLGIDFVGTFVLDEDF